MGKLSNTAALASAPSSGGRVTSVNIEKLSNGFLSREYDENYNCKETFHETRPTIKVESPKSASRSGSSLSKAVGVLRGK